MWERVIEMKESHHGPAMAVEDEVRELQEAVRTLANSGAANARAIAAVLDANSKLAEVLAGSAQPIRAITHMNGLLLMHLVESGVMTLEHFADSLEHTLALFEEGRDRSYLEGILGALRDVDPKEPARAFQVIVGGLEDGLSRTPR
jgi:hypothetical protein